MKGFVFALFLCILARNCSALAWHTLNNRAYYVNSNAYVSFDGANESCYNIGATLAKVNSSAIGNFLSRISLPGRLFYIGLKRISQGGQFQWVDGTALGYTDWEPGQPSNGGNDEGCVMALSYYHIFQWHDYPCAQRAGFICQRYVSVEPTTAATKPPTIKPKITTTDGVANFCQVKTHILIVTLVLLLVSICANMALFRCCYKLSKRNSVTREERTNTTRTAIIPSVRKSIHHSTQALPTEPEENAQENDVAFVRFNPGFSADEGGDNDQAYVEFNREGTSDANGQLGVME